LTKSNEQLQFESQFITTFNEIIAKKNVHCRFHFDFKEILKKNYKIYMKFCYFDKIDIKN